MAKDKPKSMLEVAGRPFIDWQLAKLRACGFDRIVLCIGHMGLQIAAHVGIQTGVLYSDEGEGRLGTGGALRLALPLLEEKFLVTYGDNYLPFDYAEPMRELVGNQDCDAVMSVFYEAHGNVDVIGDFVSDIGGTGFGATEYGAIAMKRAIVQGIPSNLSMGLGRLLRGYAHAHALRAYAAAERYHEIGSPDGLAETAAYLRGLA